MTRKTTPTGQMVQQFAEHAQLHQLRKAQQQALIAFAKYEDKGVIYQSFKLEQAEKYLDAVETEYHLRQSSLKQNAGALIIPTSPKEKAHQDATLKDIQHFAKTSFFKNIYQRPETAPDQVQKCADLYARVAILCNDMKENLPSQVAFETEQTLDDMKSLMAKYGIALTNSMYKAQLRLQKPAARLKARSLFRAKTLPAAQAAPLLLTERVMDAQAQQAEEDRCKASTTNLMALAALAAPIPKAPTKKANKRPEPAIANITDRAESDPAIIPDAAVETMQDQGSETVTETDTSTGAPASTTANSAAGTLHPIYDQSGNRMAAWVTKAETCVTASRLRQIYNLRTAYRGASQAKPDLRMFGLKRVIPAKRPTQHGKVCVLGEDTPSDSQPHAQSSGQSAEHFTEQPTGQSTVQPTGAQRYASDIPAFLKRGQKKTL